jgi:hypothetical protein
MSLVVLVNYEARPRCPVRFDQAMGALLRRG